MLLNFGLLLLKKSIVLVVIFIFIQSYPSSIVYNSNNRLSGFVLVYTNTKQSLTKYELNHITYTYLLHEVKNVCNQANLVSHVDSHCQPLHSALQPRCRRKNNIHDVWNTQGRIDPKRKHFHVAKLYQRSLVDDHREQQ